MKCTRGGSVVGAASNAFGDGHGQQRQHCRVGAHGLVDEADPVAVGAALGAAAPLLADGGSAQAFQPPSTLMSAPVM